MGLVESTLKPQIVKPLVRADTLTPLPSLTIDSCKFTDDSYGFIIQVTDLAKNISVHKISLKALYLPIENVYTYLGHNQTILTFSKNKLTESVYCILNLPNSPGPIICDCVSTYEPIGDEKIDSIARLFSK